MVSSELRNDGIVLTGNAHNSAERAPRAGEFVVSGSTPLKSASIFDELEMIYRNAGVALGLFDRELRFVRVNQMLAEINGVSIADHIGHTLHEV